MTVELVLLLDTAETSTLFLGVVWPLALITTAGKTPNSLPIRASVPLRRYHLDLLPEDPT